MAFVFICVAVIAFLFLLSKAKMRKISEVRITDIPAIFDKLQATKKDSNFAQFDFYVPMSNLKEEMVTVQFSIEDGRIGFDWILLCEQNVRDRGKFVQAGRAIEPQNYGAREKSR